MEGGKYYSESVRLVERHVDRYPIEMTFLPSSSYGTPLDHVAVRTSLSSAKLERGRENWGKSIASSSQLHEQPARSSPRGCTNAVCHGYFMQITPLALVRYHTPSRVVNVSCPQIAVENLRPHRVMGRVEAWQCLTARPQIPKRDAKIGDYCKR